MAATISARTQPRSPRNPILSTMGVWCMVVAALPIVASEFGLTPLYDSQRRMLPAYAAFFCFLAFAYVFSLRHGLARRMFGMRLLWTDAPVPQLRRPPRGAVNYLLACLIAASIASAATYLWAFESGRGSPTFPALPRSSADAVVLALSYIAMFLLAEGALAIMAVREYLQDVLRLSDAEVITGVPKDARLDFDSAPESALVAAPSATIAARRDYQVSEFDPELVHSGSGGGGHGLLRKIKMTLSIRH